MEETQMKRVRWRKILTFVALQGIYSVALIAATFWIAYSKSQCAKVNPDGSLTVFVGEVCRQK